ncbi:hypothetical protein GF325_14840 [Candidatus Bathyarchaeota archaeon]|nr:hypothetical protein [Candidatus Bathyarchaeota archaeon]
MTDWKALFEELSKTPTGTIEFIIRGVILAETDKDLADQVLAFAFPKGDNTEDQSSISGYRLRKKGNGYYMGQFAKDKNIIRSYGGASYKNGYSFDPDNIKITVTKEDIGEKEAKIFIKSGGKDNPTPVKLKKNKHGQWKLFTGFSSMATGVRKIKDEGDF